MSRRANLASLLDTTATELDAESASLAPVQTARPRSAAEPDAAPRRRRQPPTQQDDDPAAASSADPAGEGPRYLQLERKELRLRADQADQLAALTRRLNRTRRGNGERITDNTLIRVAIDLLLRDADRLRGTTEEELRKSSGA